MCEFYVCVLQLFIEGTLHAAQFFEQSAGHIVHCEQDNQLTPLKGPYATLMSSFWYLPSLLQVKFTMLKGPYGTLAMFDIIIYVVAISATV